MTIITVRQGLDIAFVPVPPGMPDSEEYGSSAGDSYNQLYAANEEYEFHSLPYGILPPVKTGLKVADWQMCLFPDLGLTHKEIDNLISECMSAGFSPAKQDYVTFSRFYDSSKKEADILQQG